MNVIIANKYKEMLMNLDIEVIKSIEGIYDVEEIINEFSNFYFDRMIIDITAIKNCHNIDVLQKLSINFDMNKIILLLDDDEGSTSSEFLSKLVSIGIYNFTRNSDGIKYLISNPNQYRDVVHLQNVNIESNNSTIEHVETPIYSEKVNRVIGVKSLTEGAGATTLVYLLKKTLESSYTTSILEVDKNDMHFFDDNNVFRTTSANLIKDLMKRRDDEVVLVDLNSYSDPEVCSDVLYLIEPSTIKLNKLMTKDRKLNENHKNHKIVLVKSFINNSSIKDFEYETGLNVFYNLPSLNDRITNHTEISGLLKELGFTRINSSSEDNSKSKLLGMFKI